MNRFDLHQIYKKETGESPIVHEIDCYRSKGLWVIPHDSIAVCHLNRSAGLLEIIDPDYVEWLENRLLEL